MKSSKKQKIGDKLNYRKVEYKFRISDLIDHNQEYHLWICSFSLALQDLLKTHNLMFNLKDSKEFPDYIFFFYKIALGFVKETMDLIEDCLKSDSGDCLRSIPWFNEKHSEFTELIKSNPDYNFVKGVLEESRNKVFHYNNYYRNNDAKSLKRILVELDIEKAESSLVLSRDDPFSNDLRFAEDIQVNQLAKILEKRSRSSIDGSNLNKVSKVMADLITLLRIIIHDFIAKNQNNQKIRKINYR